jgi:hypothetical protein
MKIKGYQYSFIKISKVAEASVVPKPLKNGDALNSGKLRLTYTGFNQETSQLQFTLLNKALDNTEDIGIGMGFYYSYQHFNQFNDGGQNSGDYIFRPKSGQFEALAYSKVFNQTIMEGSIESELVF